MKWDKGKVKLFISHLSKHKALAAEVAAVLDGYGIHGFVAHNDIPGSKPWRDEIFKALRGCDAIALLLHEGFYESEWCDQETGIAYAFDKKIIPIRFEDRLFPRGWANDFQAHDCRHSDAEDVAGEIVTALVSEMEFKDKLGESAIASLGESQSFKMANERVLHVKRLIPDDEWTQDLADKLEATLDNSQVSGAWQAKAYVKGIVKKEWPPF